MTKRILLTGSVTLAYCFVWQLLEKIMYGQVQNRLVDDIILLLFIPIIWLAMRNIGVCPNILNVQHGTEGEVIEIEWICPICGLHSLQEVPVATYCQSCGSRLNFKKWRSKL